MRQEIEGQTGEVTWGARLNRRRFLRLVALGAGAGTLVSLGVACQQAAAPAPPKPAESKPGEAKPAEAKPAESKPAAEAKPAQQAPAVAGASPVIVMQGVDANTLDPAFRNSVPEFTMNAHVFSFHTWRDPKSLKIVPEFVQEWKLVDERTWEFKIPSGAKFHDGTPADAEAVKFSLTRQAKQQVGGKPTIQGTFGRLTSFDSAEVVNATTVRMKTKDPAAIVPDLLASVEVMPPGVYADESEANLAKIATQPVGSGAYKLVEWVKDDRVVLEAFDGYWGPKPNIKQVIVKPVPELSTRVLALQNGQADVIVNVAPDQVPIVERSEKGRISKVAGGRNIFIGMRYDRPFLTDKRVRQAFNYAFNFDAVNRALLNGAGTRTKTILNPPHEPPDVKPYPYDLEKAKSLLSEAGWKPGSDGILNKDGQKFSVTLMSPSGRYIKDKEIAQAVQQDLQRLGVEVELKVLDWSVYAGDILNKRDPSEIFLLGLGAPFTGQEELNYIHKDFSLNSTHWENDEYHKLFDELKVTLDDKKRQDLMNQMWAIAYDDPPWIYVYHQVDFYGVSKRIEWEAAATERIRMTEAKLVG
ncbi:MAG TPA: ABC transporter substrate-binding protein [Chloroflexota bacterium]|nr:ABC transporter substrate-binding protein [Chloroflexota bacterium]